MKKGRFSPYYLLLCLPVLLALVGLVWGRPDSDRPWTTVRTWKRVWAPRHNPGGLLFSAPIGPIVAPPPVEPPHSPPLFGFQLVSLPPCTESVNGQVVWADLSTGTTNGVKNPLGSADPKWHLTLLSRGPGIWPAYSIYPDNPPYAWVANPGTGANWIESNKPSPPYYEYDALVADSPEGNYTYVVLFYLDLALYSSIEITGQFAADDASNPSLNNGPLGPTGSFHAWTPFTIGPVAPSAPFPFENGVNNLEFLNYESPSPPEGLIVDAKLLATCQT